MGLFEDIRNWMRFGEGGEYVESDITGRRIVKIGMNYKDTVYFACNCFINGRFDCVREGNEAVIWVMEGEENGTVFCG